MQVRGPYRRSYIVPHGNGFKFLRSVPKAFRKAVGKTAWVKTLGNVSQAEAERRAAALNLEVVRELRSLERLRPGQLAEIEAAGGMDGWRSRVQQIGRLDAISAPFLELAAELDPNEDEPESMQAADVMAAVRSKRELKAIAARRQHIDDVERTLAGASPKEFQLLSLVTLHEKVAPPRSFKTTEKARLYVKRFVEVVGDLAPQQVTRQHVIKFRDALEVDGLNPDNVTQHLAKLHTLFNVALSEGVVQSNPAYRVKARKGNGKLSEGKKGFDGSQARRIFKALPGETADFQWIIKLLAYHGARGTEVCQLKCSDVATLHGVPVLRIHDKHGLVKNRQSVRDIPIHPKCKGIIAYAAKTAKTHGEASWLFRSLRDSKQGRGHGFQNYGNGKFLREKVGIKERSYSLHSYRHMFSTLCREVGMPDSVKYALLGHSLGRGEGGKYGEGPSLKLRARWIAKVDPQSV